MGALAGSLLLGVTACTPLDRVAVRQIDSQMVFVVCDKINVQEFVVLAKSESDAGAELVPYWDASGEGTFGPGDPVTYGVVPEGFETSKGPIELPLSDARISFTAIERGGRSSVEGVYVASEISDAYWLQMGGDHTDEACA